MGHATDVTEKKQLRAAESRIEFIVSGFFTLLLAGTLAYVWTLFEPIAPRPTLILWTVLMGTAIAVMMAVPIVFLLRQPDDTEIVRLWAPIGKITAVQYDIAVAASIWMLLPYASEDLRLLMVIFFISAISGQVISTAEALANNAFGILAILGSIVIFYLRTPGPYSVGIAVFCATFGVLLFAVAVALRQAIRSALSARLDAEAVSEQLARALAETEAERDSKARFIAAASHDLRQPLHAASLFFEQTQTAKLETVRTRAAEGVRAAFQSAGKLLDAILEHLRLESGNLDLDLKPVSVESLFRKIAALHSLQAHAAGMQIRVRSTNHWVCADAAMLERVISNLVVNGIKHSRGDRVLLTSRRRGDKIELCVVDNGVGVEDANRQLIFEEYAQGDRVKLDPRGGLGLGLASARRIVELHDARLDLNTCWTGGAAFSTCLAQAEPDETQAERLSDKTNASISDTNILVVEDDEAAGQALVSLLKNFEAQAEWAGSVHAARITCRSFQPDILITDWRLSLNETGADAIKAVRQHYPCIPVIVLTGDGAPETLDKITATGAMLLHKPATAEKLKSAIAHILASRGTTNSCVS